MKKFVPSAPEAPAALQAARRAYAEASARKRYATARMLTGMSGAERVSMLKAAKQLVRIAINPANFVTISLVKK